MSYSAFLARLFSEVFSYPPLPHIEYFSICWCRLPVDRYSQWADWTIKKSYSRNSISFSSFDMINNSKTNFLWLRKRILLEKENNITWPTHCITLQGIFYEYFENKCKTWTQLIQGIADECAGGKPWFDFFFFSLKRSVPLIESVMNWHLIA